MKIIDVSDVPMYLDGSGAGMWMVHPDLSWSEVLNGQQTRKRRYIRVSDLIELMEREDIKLVYGQSESEKA